MEFNFFGVAISMPDSMKQKHNIATVHAKTLE